MQTVRINNDYNLKEGEIYKLSFINKEMWDLAVNVNGRIRNALSELNKEITIDNYFSEKNNETQEYLVYFTVVSLNKDQYSINYIKDFIIDKSEMAGVDLKYNLAEKVTSGEVEKEDYLDSISKDINNIMQIDDIKTLLALGVLLYGLSIAKDFTE